MAQHAVDVDTQTQALMRRLDQLEARVRVLEDHSALASATTSPTAPSADEIEVRLAGAAESVSTGFLPLAGRTLLVLGGALLFRALTDEHILPAWGGVAAGLMYAAFWLQRADAGARRPEGRPGGVLHALTALAIGYPLIVETTLRFRVTSPTLAGLLIVACFAGGLLVSERRQFRLLAWVNAILAAVSALVLQAGTRDLLPLTASLLAIGTLVEARDRRAAGPRAIVAIAADLAVAVCVIIGSRAEGLPEGYPPLPLAGVVVFALLLPTLYVGSAAWRTLRDAESLGAFAILQAPTALLIGFAGASSVLAVQQAPTWPIGAAASLLSLGCYLAAFSVVDRRADRATTFYAYTTFALLLAFGGLGQILSRGQLAIALGVLGSLVLALAEAYKRQTLRFHGVAYIVASAGAAGVLRAAWNGLVADPRASWQEVSWLGWLGLLLLGLGYALLVRGDHVCGDRQPLASRGAHLAQMLAAAALLVSAVGIVAMRLCSFVALASGPEADLAQVAAIRAVLLAATAVGIAWASVRFARRELVPLAYVALAVGALSVLLQNLPAGRPATLFVTLAAYGGALLATPRLLGRRPSARGDAP